MIPDVLRNALWLPARDEADILERLAHLTERLNDPQAAAMRLFGDRP